MSKWAPDHVARGGMGVRGGAVCHISPISAGVRLEQPQARSLCILHSAFCLERALQFQGLGGEGAGGLNATGGFLAQGRSRSIVSQ